MTARTSRSSASSACLSWRPSWIQASAALSSAASIPASSVTRFLPSLTRRRFSAASAESERCRPSAVAVQGDGRRSVRTERSVEGPAERSVGSIPTRRSLLLWDMAPRCAFSRGFVNGAYHPHRAARQRMVILAGDATPRPRARGRFQRTTHADLRREKPGSVSAVSLPTPCSAKTARIPIRAGCRESESRSEQDAANPDPSTNGQE